MNFTPIGFEFSPVMAMIRGVAFGRDGHGRSSRPSARAQKAAARRNASGEQGYALPFQDASPRSSSSRRPTSAQKTDSGSPRFSLFG